MDAQGNNTLNGFVKTLSGPSPPMVDDRALYRKIDVHVIALLFASYLIQILDKTLLNYANIMGLQEDLGLHGQQFSWLTTAFFIAYTVAEFPHGWLLQKFLPATVLGMNVLVWGILVTTMAACHDFVSLLVVRILLGAFEAVIIPALILITSQWYTKRESTLRYGLWHCGSGTGQIIGGLISFAGQYRSRTASLSGWRIMFIAVGLFNIILALLILFLLPKTLDTASWLSEAEKTRIREKLTLDQAGTGKKVFRKTGLIEALAFDLQVWILFFMTVLIVIPVGAIMTFSAALIRGFGYDTKSAALLIIPCGVVSIIATLGCTYAILIDFPRCFGIIAAMASTFIGAGLMSFYHGGKGGVLAGIYLLNFIVAPVALLYALAGVNTRGYTKKVTTNATIMVGYGIGNIISPQTFLSREAPGFITAKITIFAASGAVIVLAAMLWLLYGWRNRQRIKERQAELDAFHSRRINILAFEGREEETDMQNKAFVYVY
ncbi:putative allantoate permease [Xylaria sp. FL1042]|nr:putative allantoate permease [Xylaria sp. FL1042]